MQVSDVMSVAAVTDSAADSLRAAASLMWSEQTGSLLVMDGGRLAGIVTERDVMKAVARGQDPDQTTVADVMTAEVLTVSPSTPLFQAARTMASRWIRHLPVVEDGAVLGVLSQRDIVGVLAALDADPEAQELAADELVRDRRLVRIEHGDLD